MGARAGAVEREGDLELASCLNVDLFRQSQALDGDGLGGPAGAHQDGERGLCHCEKTPLRFSLGLIVCMCLVVCSSETEDRAGCPGIVWPILDLMGSFLASKPPSGGGWLVVVSLLVLNGWDVCEVAVEAFVAVPVNP